MAGRSQVLDEAGWMERLHLMRRDVGTSMKETEVGDFSRQVDLAALRAYRVAVGRRTHEIVSQLQPAQLRESIDPTNIQRLLMEGAFELAKTWAGWKKAGMLTMPATRHSFTHLNQARAIRHKLEKRGGYKNPQR